MGEEFIENLKDWIVSATEEIFKEAYCSNVKNPNEAYPLLISENDLTCELYKRLSTHPEIRITTEVSIPRKEGGNRYDIGIFPSNPSFKDLPCGCYYKKDRNGNPMEWDCDKYLGFIEIKNNWWEFQKGSTLIEGLTKDLKKLLNGKKKAWFLMSIFFDYMGLLDLNQLKKLLEEDEYKDIDCVYADIKRGNLYIKVNQTYHILSNKDFC